MFVETAAGYFHLHLTCSSIPTITNATRAQSPAECGLECDGIKSCVGFHYYVDNGGSQNLDKIGMCEHVSSFDLGTCDSSELNADIYLRADIGASCQAQCNIHQLYSAYVFEREVCELYSLLAEFRTTFRLGRELFS